MEEKRKLAIQALANMMETTSFTVECKLAEKPKGIRVIIEVTKEEMDKAVNQLKEERKGI